MTEEPDARARVRVRRVAEGDSYVRVSSVGEQGSRAFVLVAGIGVSSNYFERLASHLNGYGPVHALDLPGFGGVPHPDHRLRIDDFAELVGRAVDELGLHDPILVGHSMGTQVVTALAARRPELSTVVLIGPVVNAAERRVLRQAWCFLRSAAREPGRVKLLALSAYVVCGPRWFSRILPEMMRHRIEDDIGSVAASVLLIRGDQDPCCPRPWVTALAERHPRNKIWEVPDAAHSVMYVHAEEVAELCARYARDPGSDDDTVHRSARLDSAAPSTSAAGRARRLRDRLRELRGMVSGDDRLLERARSDQAAVQREAEPETHRPTETTSTQTSTQTSTEKS